MFSSQLAGTHLGGMACLCRHCRDEGIDPSNKKLGTRLPSNRKIWGKASSSRLARIECLYRNFSLWLAGIPASDVGIPPGGII
jgi:hypothetical protein